jgi:hypothetical protein
MSELVSHDPGCAGGHLESISCAAVAELRARAAGNLWYCHGATTSGYHRFSGHEDPPLDAQCDYEGCSRTWGELQEAARNP